MTDTPMTPDHDRPICTQVAARAAGLDVAPSPEELLATAESIVTLWGGRWAEPDDTVASLADAGAQLARTLPLVLAEVDRLRARVAELEALKPARFQDCQVCGAGYEYGHSCTQCEFKKRIAAAIDEGPDDLPRDLSPEQARMIERDRPETDTAHDCNIPLSRRLDCGHCPHEVCQDCDRCPHTCRCASTEGTS